MAISTDSRLQQVKAYMLSYITQNKLKRNDQLPSEAAISKELGVSRNTLREAYISLENEGIIVRRHGIGTFVANPPLIQDSLNDFSPFAQIIQNVGYTPNFKTLAIEKVSPPPEVKDVLKLEGNEQVRKISRLVYADQKPVIYVEDHLPPDVDSQVDSWKDFKGNMVEVLVAALATPLHQIQSYIRAGSLPAGISQYLDLPEEIPVLSVRSTIFNKENRPVTFSRLWFNSDVIELNIVRMI
ncbi:MAG: GntR family transcriptional regulator [Anaerolineales bacterium]